MKQFTISIILLIAVLVFLNLVSEQYYLRFDLTEDNQYSLSQATKDILNELDEPVTVKAYFTESLPPNIQKTKDDVQDLLVEYNRLSDNYVVYEFINPNQDEDTQRKAMQAGIQPIMIDVREKDQMKQQRAYMGLVLEMGENKEVIPFIEPNGALEYTLSSAIKKLAVKEKPTIGLIQGHGEPALHELSQVRSELAVMYQLEPYTLQDTAPIPQRFRTLALIRPTDSIPAEHLQRLSQFLARGGNLLVAINRVQGNLQTVRGTSLNTGLETWLQQRGIQVQNQFVVDNNCASVSVQQPQSFFSFQVRFPYIPIISQFSEHPATKGLEAVVMQFASPLRYTGDTTHTFTPVAFTSDLSGAQSAPLMFAVQKEWTRNDFNRKRMPVAGILQPTQAQATEGRLFVVGDGDFAVNGQQGQQLQGDNVHFMVNAIDWLSDDTGLISLRTKGITFRPLDELEDSQKTLLKYINFLLPVILLIVYGLVRMQMNKNKQIKRMQESYE